MRFMVQRISTKIYYTKVEIGFFVEIKICLDRESVNFC